MTTQTAGPELIEMVRTAIRESGRSAQFASHLTGDLPASRATSILRQLRCTETDETTVGDLPRQPGKGGGNASSGRTDYATDRQRDYALDLLRTRLADGETVIGTVKTAGQVIEQVTTSGQMARKLARDVIDMYKDRPRVQVKAEAKPASAKFEDDDRATEPGIYQVGDDIYRVKKSRSTGYLYAEKHDGKSFDYDLGRGAMRIIKASHLMTTEQAKAFGMRWGMCVNGHPLSDRTSRYFGYGECCASNNGWLYDKKLVPADFE